MSLRVTIDSVITEKLEFSHQPDYFAQDREKARSGRASFHTELALADSEPYAMVKLRAVTADTEADSVKPDYIFDVTVVVKLTIHDGDPRTEEGERELLTVGIGVLIPFLREQVAAITMRGNFGPIWLQPMHVGQMIRGLKKVAEKTVTVG